MPRSLRIESDVWVPMRDGVRILADVYRPADDERHPAILLRSFGRASRGNTLAPLIHALVDAGYAYISSEIRGRNGSEGEWQAENAWGVEPADGHDSIEWIAEQAWCDGNVGMIGASHAAGFQYMAASTNPPHLRAIAPWTGGGFGAGSGGGFRPPEAGGVTSLITSLVWLPSESADMVNRLEAGGEDVSGMRRALAQMRSDPEAVYGHLPLLDVPVAQYGRLRELWQWRLQNASHPEPDGERPWDLMRVPCFHECGWYDGPAWNEFVNFNALRQNAGTQRARDGQHIIAGPWPHAMAFAASLGDVYFGVQADSAGSGVYQSQIAFFNKYVRGREDVELPRVRYFVMGLNQWRTADAWPLPTTDWQRFYLHSGGGANGAAGDGLLSRDEPGGEPPDHYVYDPLRPVPTVGGPLIGSLEGPTIMPGPFDQHVVERRQDVLCYTTPPLAADTEVTGPIQVHLFAATSAVDTDFAAKLVHVRPDGRAFNLAEGIIRASGRALNGVRAPVTPGEVNEYVITLGVTSQLFRRGHCIRVVVTSSNFPQFDRNMNTGNPIGTDERGVAALQSIFHQSGAASYVDLPVIPSAT